MAGLINSAISGSAVKDPLEPNKILQAQAVNYNPDKRTVASNETVAGQLDTITSKGSPLIDRAVALATERSNSRGLQNSSMATQAGQAAVYDAALPIAQADAATYTLASRDNQSAGNEAGQFNANAVNQAGAQNVSEAGQTSRMKLGSDIEKGLITARTDAEKGLITAKTAAESSLSAQSATQAQAQSRVQGEIQSGLIKTQEQADARLKELTGQIETGLVATRASAESRLQAEKAQQQQDLVAAQGVIEKAVQTLRGEQGVALANIEANYKQLIQSSDSASKFYSETARDIGAVMANPDTSAEQKAVAVSKLSDVLQSGLTVIGQIGNIDIAGLLDFTKIATTTAPAAPGETTTTPTPWVPQYNSSGFGFEP